MSLAEGFIGGLDLEMLSQSMAGIMRINKRKEKKEGKDKK